MSRPMSEVLRVVYTRLELHSSIYGALDDCLRYGDITRTERTTADKMIARWLEKMSKNVLLNVTSKRQAFKKFIQTTQDAERTVI